MHLQSTSVIRCPVPQLPNSSQLLAAYCGLVSHLIDCSSPGVVGDAQPQLAWATGCSNTKLA